MIPYLLVLAVGIAWLFAMQVPLKFMEGKDKPRKFANDFCLYLAGMKWFVSNWFLALMRPWPSISMAHPIPIRPIQLLSATYAMIAAESLGLGTCMLGAIHPLIQNGKKARKFREDHGILYPSREGLFVIFGYPEVKYTKGIRRTFASVNGY